MNEISKETQKLIDKVKDNVLNDIKYQKMVANALGISVEEVIERQRSNREVR